MTPIAVRALMGIAQFLIPLGLLALAWLWMGAVAELVWAIVLRPWRVGAVLLAAAVLCLGLASIWTAVPASWLLAVLTAPVCAWIVLNLWWWLTDPGAERTVAGLFQLSWRHAFLDRECEHQRESYVPPDFPDDVDDTF